MTTTTALALYGAFLSSALALFEIVRWIAARRPRIRVEVEEGYGTGQLGNGEVRDPAVLWINVINDGELDQQIAWVYLEHPDGREWLPAAGVGPHETISARSRKVYRFIERGEVSELDPDAEIEPITSCYRVQVQLGSGRQFFSSPQPRPHGLE